MLVSWFWFTVGNAQKIARESVLLSLVPHIEALALPLVVERATQKPTLNICHHACQSYQQERMHISHRHLPLPHSWHQCLRTCKIRNRQEQSVSKRFFIHYVTPCHSPAAVQLRASAKEHGKVTQYLRPAQGFGGKKCAQSHKRGEIKNQTTGTTNRQH